jgi:hypothetical protein
MLSEAEGCLVAEDFLQTSRKAGEPELAIDWNEVRVKCGKCKGCDGRGRQSQLLTGDGAKRTWEATALERQYYF